MPQEGFREIVMSGRKAEVSEKFSERKIVTFLSRIDLADDESCWVWKGPKDHLGYGLFNMESRRLAAHRFAWMAFRGLILEGMHIHHKCINPACVNPNHLLPVTPREHAKEHTPDSRTAINASQTHCHKGHELSGENLYLFPGRGGKRRCKECHREWTRAEYKKLEKPGRVRAFTHCINGHEFTPENTYESWGQKMCRRCHADVTNRIYHEKRDASLTYNCGHPKEPENTYTDKGKKTYCLQCFIAQRVNRKKAICVNGHPRTEDNLYTYTLKATGKTIGICKICRENHEKRSYAKRRAKYAKV